jgi:CubicO group peptidase (beta-lactamase class C family)
MVMYERTDMNHSWYLPLLFLGLLLIGYLPAPVSAADAEPPASPEVAAAMQSYFDSYKLAGIIGIIADRQGKVHFKNLIGYADVEAKKPISEDNVFWIASMTKMFAGASIMMLADEGQVSLDDPVTSALRADAGQQRRTGRQTLSLARRDG